MRARIADPKSAVSVLAQVAVTCALVLACMTALAASADVEIRQIRGYRGEVEPNPDPSKACTSLLCDFYCDSAYCAHGNGLVIGGYEFGDWYYRGQFVHGQIEGFGRFGNEYFIYDGQFKANKFGDHGAITCLEGTVDGVVDHKRDVVVGEQLGELKILDSTQTSRERRIPGDYLGRIWGPCRLH